MAKALVLSEDALTATPPVPLASQSPAPLQVPMPEQGREVAAAVAVEPKTPLQVRWPADDAKNAKLATINLDFATLSDFMLACFHEYMAARGKAADGTEQ